MTITRQAQRATIERVAGVTFLPVSLAQPEARRYILAMWDTLATRRSILRRKRSKRGAALHERH
jgi:hypothetical protein